MMITRGAFVKPMSSLRKNSLAAFLSRRGYEGIEYRAALTGSTPQMMALTTDGQTHLAQVPRVARWGMPRAEMVGVLLAKFPAPLADGLIRDDYSAF